MHTSKSKQVKIAISLFACYQRPTYAIYRYTAYYYLYIFTLVPSIPKSNPYIDTLKSELRRYQQQHIHLLISNDAQYDMRMKESRREY